MSAGLDGNRAAGRDDMRVGEPVVEAVDPVGEDVGGAQPCEPARRSCRSAISARRRCRTAARRASARVAKLGEARVGGQIGPAERADEPGELLLADQRDHHPAVLRAVGAGRHVERPRAAVFEDMLGELVAEDRGGALRRG